MAPSMGLVMKLLHLDPLNKLVDQEPSCAAALAAWRDSVYEAAWEDYSDMAKDLTVAPAKHGDRYIFTVVPKICQVEAKVLFRRQIMLVASARLLRVLGRRAA